MMLASQSLATQDAIDLGWRSERLAYDKIALDRAVATAIWYRLTSPRSRGNVSLSLTPPAHWLVKRREDLLGSINRDGSNVTWELVSFGSWKRVYRALLRPSVGTKERQRVIVKKCLDDGAQGQTIGELLNELIYLEYLRGQAGVPHFLGAYRETPRQCTRVTVGGGVIEQQQSCSRQQQQQQPAVIYVVVRDSGGGRLGNNFGAASVVSASYERLTRERPLATTRAILEAFQSFSERGGFLLRDFTPQQFVVAPQGEQGVSFQLVDGPTPEAGPVRWLNDYFRSGEGDALFNNQSSSAASLQNCAVAIVAAATASSLNSSVAAADSAHKHQQAPLEACSQRRTALQRAALDKALRCASDADCPSSPMYHCCCSKGDSQRAAFYCGSNPLRALVPAGQHAPQAAPESQGLCQHNGRWHDLNEELSHVRSGHSYLRPIYGYALSFGSKNATSTTLDDSRCAPLIDLTHSHDVASKWWLLPYILSVANGTEAEAVLSGLMRQMSHPEARQRLSFSAALDWLSGIT